jgi:hypothetical protein
MKLNSSCHENKFAQFWVHNGILFFQYKPNVVIDLTAAQLVVADRILVQNERAYPILCDIRGIVAIDKAARDYLAKSGSVLTKAVSLLGSHTISLALTSFYIRINKPRVPTQIFTDELAALAFLESYT